MKFCTNKNNDSDIKQIIDSQVKVRWEEWSENTTTLIDTLFVFDFLFYNPDGESMSQTDLEENKTEWKDCILPRMKSSDLVFLFTSEWYEVMYDKLTKAFDFVVCDKPPELSGDTNMFAATTGLTYPMLVALVSLVRPIRTIQQLTEDLEQKERIPFVMTVRATHQGVCYELYKLVCKMAKEVDLWQEIKGSTSCWTQLCVKIVSRRKIGCISQTIMKQPETGVQGKNVSWETADIPVRLGTLVICIRKKMTNFIL